jgi:hypothetical protein
LLWTSNDRKSDSAAARVMSESFELYDIEATVVRNIDLLLPRQPDSSEMYIVQCLHLPPMFYETITRLPSGMRTIYIRI